MTYSYDPAQIRARGEDQMRFELGDTQTEGGESREAMVYVMTEKYRDPAMPCTDYFLGIVDGFTENGMNPHPVWEALEETEAECDREGLAV